MKHLKKFEAYAGHGVIPTWNDVENQPGRPDNNKSKALKYGENNGIIGYYDENGDYRTCTKEEWESKGRANYKYDHTIGVVGSTGGRI